MLNNAENNMKLLYSAESYKIRGAAFEVYKQLGCKHKEVVFQRAYHDALLTQELEVTREKQLPVFFNGKKVGSYIPDFIVADKILIELKAKAYVIKQDIDQFWQYLKNTNYKLGFLINFGKPGGVQIIRRVYDTAREK